MNRRGFLGSILALGAAPAIVRADSLMRIVPRETLVWTPGRPYGGGGLTAQDITMTLEQFERQYGPDQLRRLLGPRA